MLEAFEDFLEFRMDGAEDCEELGVEVFGAGAGVAFQNDAAGFFVGEAFFIAAVAAEGVVVVAEHDDAAGDGDLVASEAAGVSGAIPVFVVGDGYVASHFEEAGVGAFEDLGTAEGVAFHDFTVFDIEGASFTDEEVGDGDFADVVHGGGAEDEFLVGFGPADVAGDDAGVVADALDVGAGFVVLIDRGPGEAEDHVVVGLFEFGGATAFEVEGEFEVDGGVAEFSFEAEGFALA